MPAIWQSGRPAVVFVGTRKTDLWAVTDRTKNRTADEVKRFAPAISFTQPGPCFSPDGFLFVAEHNRVLVFPAAEFFYEGRTWRRTSWCRPAS